MAYTEEQLGQALLKAHEAGDVASATALTAEIKRLRAGTSEPKPEDNGRRVTLKLANRPENPQLAEVEADQTPLGDKWAKVGRGADDLARSIAQGATFNMADEFAALMASKTGIGKQPGAGDDYASNVAAERARDAAIAPEIAIPGQLVGGLATGKLAGKAGLTLLNNAKPTIPSLVTRGAGEGAVYGSLYGAGSGETPEQRLSNAVYGAFLGGGTGGAMGGAAGATLSKPSVPTTEALKKQANAAYKQAEQAGAVMSETSFAGLADDIAATAKKEGINARIHPDATAALEDIVAAKGSTQTLEQLDTLRQIVKSAAESNKPSERRLARIMTDKIDDYVSGLSSKDLVSGDANTATTALTSARDLWSKTRKGEAIERLLDRAKIKASGYSASGYENALRAEFRSLALNDKRMRAFTKTEQDAIRRVAEGGAVENVLRGLGKMAPRGVVSGGFNVGVAAVDPTLGLATLLTGEAARRGATAMTSRNANNAALLMRSGGKLPEARPLTPVQQRLLANAIRAQAQMLPEQTPLFNMSR